MFLEITALLGGIIFIVFILAYADIIVEIIKKTREIMK